MSRMSAAQAPLLDGATPEELAEFSRVAQIVLPIAKDSIGNAAPPVTVSDFAGGASANMPPALICTVALFAGA